MLRTFLIIHTVYLDTGAQSRMAFPFETQEKCAKELSAMPSFEAMDDKIKIRFCTNQKPEWWMQ